MKNEDFDRAFDDSDDEMDKVIDWSKGIRFYHVGTNNETYAVCYPNGEKLGEITQLENGEYVFMPMPDDVKMLSEGVLKVIAWQLHKWNQPLKNQPDSDS